MGLIFLIGLIVLLANLPKLVRSTPDQFPVYDPDIHARWKRAILRAHYAFLAAIAAFGITVTFLTMIVDTRPGATSQVSAIQSAFLFLGLLGPIPVLIWAVVLNRQALKLKGQLSPPLPAGYSAPFDHPIQMPQSPPPDSEPGSDPKA